MRFTDWKAWATSPLGTVWLFGACLGFLLTPGHRTMESPDTEVLEYFLQTGTIGREPKMVDGSPTCPAKPCFYLPGVGGRYYPGHEIGSDLLTFPLACVAWLARPWFPFERVFELLVGFGGAFLFATTLALGVILVQCLGVPGAFARTHVVPLLAASQYLVYGLHMADISISSPLFVLAAVLWCRIEKDEDSPKTWCGLGACLSFLITIKLTNTALAAVVVLLILHRMIRQGTLPLWQLGAFAAGCLPGLLLNGWWNWFRSGSPLRTLYDAQHSFQMQQFWPGLAGTLFHPLTSPFVYSPVLFAAIPFLLAPSAIRVWNSVRLLVLGSLAVAILRLSGTSSWHGVSGWGIRYYVPWAAALAVLVTVVWWQNRRLRLWAMSLRLLIGIGITMSLSGTLTNWLYRQGLCGLIDHYPNAMVCAVRILPANLARTAGISVPEPTIADAPSSLTFVSNRIDVWWFAIQTQGIPAAVGWLLASLLFAMLIFLTRRIHSQSKS